MTYPAAWEGRALSPVVAAEKVGLLVFYGQSNRTNRAEGTAQCVRDMTTARAADYVWMMNNARAPGANEEVWSDADATRLLPLRDCNWGNRAYGDTPTANDPLGQSLSSAAYVLHAADIAAGRTPRRRIFLACGVGGREIVELEKGAAPVTMSGKTFVCWDRMLAMVSRAVTLARVAWGMDCEVEFFDWGQGEAEISSGITQAAYKSALEGLFADALSDLKAITAQANDFPCTFDQVPSDLRGGGNVASLAQAEIALAGTYHCYGSSYGYPFSVRDDGEVTAHRTARGAVAWGEMIGAAWAALRAGESVKRCQVLSVAVDGNDILLTCNRPVGVDVKRMPNPGNFGFKLTHGSATISSVSAGIGTDGRTIRVRCSASPAGGTLEYAYDNPAGVVVSGRAGLTRLDGETELNGDPAKTPGSWGLIRASDRNTACAYVDNLRRQDWLMIGRWAL